MVEVRPYAGVGPLHFGTSPAQAAEHVGAPQTVTTNRYRETVHRYSTMRLTFDDEGLAEVSILPDGEPRLRALDPLTRDGLTRLVAEDGDAQEVVGFIVLLNLGIAVSGVNDNDPGQLAVTAFRRGRWDKLRDQMKPLSLSKGRVS